MKRKCSKLFLTTLTSFSIAYSGFCSYNVLASMQPEETNPAKLLAEDPKPLPNSPQDLGLRGKRTKNSIDPELNKKIKELIRELKMSWIARKNDPIKLNDHLNTEGEAMPFWDWLLEKTEESFLIHMPSPRKKNKIIKIKLKDFTIPNSTWPGVKKLTQKFAYEIQTILDRQYIASLNVDILKKSSEILKNNSIPIRYKKELLSALFPNLKEIKNNTNFDPLTKRNFKFSTQITFTTISNKEDEEFEIHESDQSFTLAKPVDLTLEIAQAVLAHLIESLALYH